MYVESDMQNSLLTPDSIAVIGASKTPGKVGYEVLENLQRGGFEGALVPINPTATEIPGLPCYASVQDYGKPIDLAIVVVPAAIAKQAIQGAISGGAKGVVVITAGFKEVGEQGAKLEEELVALCRQNQVRMMGPNCIGFINTQHKLNATFAPIMPKPGSISVISQSGALCVAILDYAEGMGQGLGKVISVGNKGDLNEVDFLSMLKDDPDTRVIAGYLESISEGDEFLRIAEQVASEKPEVILKVGVTQAGAKAASSNTGSLAGADMAYGAAFRRSGVIRAETFEALFDYAIAFDM